MRGLRRLAVGAVLAGLGAMGAVAQTVSPAWQPLGPSQVASSAYGKVTGRVTAISIDPSDANGNTVYLGTAGGGVWKSTNAAGAASDVSFAPLTDTLPVFNANAGATAIPSLSIGAVIAKGNIVLAGTGDPNNATDSFYSEGLLRSADGGLTWTLVRGSDDAPNQNYLFRGRAFAGLAWSTANAGTVVAAVSDSARGNAMGAVDGIAASESVMGLYYSTDAGASWHMSTLMDGTEVVQQAGPAGSLTGGNAATSVVWNPVRQRFYAAVRFHGYYESADGGKTWTRLAQQPGTRLTATACPVNQNLPGSSGCPIFRGALAVEPVSGDMYALTVSSDNTDQGLWRDVCAASGGACAGSVAFGQRLGEGSFEDSGSTTILQGDYNLSLAAVASGVGPNSDTVVLAGTVDLYRCSVASGCATMRNTTNALNACQAPARVAPAQHAIAARAVAGGLPVVLVGNDGGLWRSSDGVNQQGPPCDPSDAAHFENLNGGLGSLAQVAHLAQHPTDPANLIAGMGANGTAATTMARTDGFGAWSQLAASEGGAVAIDPANPDLWYVSTAAGVSIARCASGGACTASDFAGIPAIGPGQVASDRSPVDTPWLLDPGMPANLIAGTCRVWRGAADGTGWPGSDEISTILGTPINGVCGDTNAMVRSLAAGGPVVDAAQVPNSGSQVIYAGMAGALDGGGSFAGHLFSMQRADEATGVSIWDDRALSPVTTNGVPGSFNPGGYDISSVAVDPHDPTGHTVYATVAGFGVPHLYRSTDAGANWTNISRNLPDAPANSVAVDPNDANTVYVAMDTGVYATTGVAGCESENCWNVYGVGLPNAPVMQLAAAGGMPTGDGRRGELRVATYGRGVWQIPLLAAINPAKPAMQLSQSSLSFAEQAIGTLSAAQAVTVTNSGDAPLHIDRIDISMAQLPLGPQAEFSQTNTCTGAAVAPGASCSVAVSFGPAAVGARSATMTIFGDVEGGQATVALSGTAVTGGQVGLTPLFLGFGSIEVSKTSAAQNIAISNTGGSPVSIGTPGVSGDFRISASTCGASLRASEGCTVGVVFTPTVAGARTGSLTIAGNDGTLTASLSGTGVLAATDALAPASVAFAPQILGTTSAVQYVTLTNAGDEALTLISARATGDFAAVNTCGNSLAGHSSCTVGVIFQPTVLGAAAGALVVADQFRSQSVALSGTGLAPAGASLSPLFSMSFPATGVGLTSAPKVVTLTNNGGVPLNISTVAVSGDFVIVPGSNNCGDVLAPNAACTMQVAFRPTAGGVRQGALSVTDSALSSPQTLPLSGPGVEFTLASNGPSSVTIASGQNAVFPLLFTSGPALAGTQVSLACAGAPQNATCNITPSSLALDGNATTASVTVLTGVTASAGLAGQGRVFWGVWLLPMGLLPLRRRRRAVALLCVLVAIAGCGGGSRLIPPSSPPDGGGGGAGPATPSGTYAITVTATSAGLTRTVNLTLNVQ